MRILSHAVFGMMLMCCEVVLAAVLGSTTRIPAITPGLPDIIQTTFLVARPSNISSKIQDVSSPTVVSITDQPCTTTCSGTAGTGPSQFDCTTIANSLRGGSQGGNNVTLSPFLGTEFAFRSCKIVVSNQDAGASVVSTQKSIAAVAQKLAASCNAAHNAAGGECKYAKVNTGIAVQHT